MSGYYFQLQTQSDILFLWAELIVVVARCYSDGHTTFSNAQSQFLLMAKHR